MPNGAAAVGADGSEWRWRRRSPFTRRSTTGRMPTSRWAIRRCTRFRRRDLRRQGWVIRRSRSLRIVESSDRRSSSHSRTPTSCCTGPSGTSPTRPRRFAARVSFWLSVDPAEIPGQYCDPLQVTDKKYSDACIWVDFTKNDTPSDFRLGVFGDASVWDPDGKEGGGERFFWRLVKVAEPPFAKGRWTHVVITWDGLNDTQAGRARLYFDGRTRARPAGSPSRSAGTSATPTSGWEPGATSACSTISRSSIAR